MRVSLARCGGSGSDDGDDGIGGEVCELSCGCEGACEVEGSSRSDSDSGLEVARERLMGLLKRLEGVRGRER